MSCQCWAVTVLIHWRLCHPHRCCESVGAPGPAWMLLLLRCSCFCDYIAGFARPVEMQHHFFSQLCVAFTWCTAFLLLQGAMLVSPSTVSLKKRQKDKQGTGILSAAVVSKIAARWSNTSFKRTAREYACPASQAVLHTCRRCTCALLYGTTGPEVLGSLHLEIRSSGRCTASANWT